MKKDETLPAAERIVILTGRIEKLKGGAGSYPNASSRQTAIDEAEDALRCAVADFQMEKRATH